jgi:hypothetical protein
MDMPVRVHDLDWEELEKLTDDLAEIMRTTNSYEAGLRDLVETMVLQLGNDYEAWKLVTKTLERLQENIRRRAWIGTTVGNTKALQRVKF